MSSWHFQYRFHINQNYYPETVPCPHHGQIRYKTLSEPVPEDLPSKGHLLYPTSLLFLSDYSLPLAKLWE
ncbi:MAG: DUF723 domain-containing protein [Prevotella sp.]|nr:DUF723 domain-containing protein [Prevotella sp.]